MFLHAVHRTLYEYPCPSVESHNEVRLMPLSDASQRCLSFELKVRPNAKVFSYHEVGGTVHHFSIREPHDSLEIIATATVETLLSDPFSGLDLLGDDWGFYESDDVRQAHVEYLVESSYTPFLPEVLQIANQVRKPGMSVASYLIELTDYINKFLSYDPDATHVYSTLDEVVAGKGGVCQDFAHLAIACARSLGIPAKYVSGYLYGGSSSYMRGELATHAWFECLMPDGRWLALDPTNNLLASDHYIRVHIGRDYTDVAPTSGIYIGARASKLEVGVRVVEITEIAASA